MTTQHPSQAVSASELLIELGCNPISADAKNPASNANKANKVKDKNFLVSQYPLFSTPLVILYLQGPAAFVDYLPTDPNEMLTVCMQNVIVRKVGRPTAPIDAITITNRFIKSEGYKKLYTDKEFHKAHLIELLESGLTLNKDKAANRTKVIETINLYLTDLANFLTANGYSSNLEYAEAQVLSKGKNRIINPNNISQEDWDSL